MDVPSNLASYITIWHIHIWPFNYSIYLPKIETIQYKLLFATYILHLQYYGYFYKSIHTNLLYSFNYFFLLTEKILSITEGKKLRKLSWWKSALYSSDPTCPLLGSDSNETGEQSFQILTALILTYLYSYLHM